MIELYTWNTPNGRKIAIALEELQLPYRVFPIDITKGEQTTPEFLRISPNNRIPAIVDTANGFTLMESGAILLYLAELTGKLLPPAGPQRYRAIEWLMWQMGGPGPTFGQAHAYLKFNKGAAPFAEERLMKEVLRLYGVLDRRLDLRDYLADEYSIADIATWPWVSRYEWHQVNLADFPNVLRWYRSIAARPAVRRGYKVPQDVGEIPIP